MTSHHWNVHPHRRLNILTGEWVLVSPHRTARPWQGGEEIEAMLDCPAHDPACYLCPGNTRAGGHENPQYDGAYVFDNDFASLVPDTPSFDSNADELIVFKSETGTCRVVCFSPRHDLTLAEMACSDIRCVIDLWSSEYRHLAEDPTIAYVQIFENKGSAMGCSNPHPHGQIWAQRSIPDEPAKELARMLEHYERNGRPILLDYLDRELQTSDRLVWSNDSFVVLVPFWATWPFEVMILPRRNIQNLLDMTSQERDHFAESIHRITVRYDNLFNTSFPYSSGIHQAPTDGNDYPECTFHMHFYPPLLRSASVKKFMVGYEMLAGPQRDITAESAAQILRDQSDTHFSRNTDHGSQ